MKNYKDFINQLIYKSPLKGVKTKLAAHLGCNPGFISQVLNGQKTNFSLDHLYLIGDFFNLSSSRKKLLLKLWIRDKVSSEEYQFELDQEIAELQKSKTSISENISPNITLRDQEKAVYYSHWIFPITHIMISLERFGTEKEISKHLNVSSEIVKEALHFLEENRLIEKVKGCYEIGPTRIHLDKNSPFLRMMHMNFRKKAVDDFQKGHDFNLNYSSVFTMKKEDVEELREEALKFIKRKEKILASTKGKDDVVVLNLDLLKA